MEIRNGKREKFLLVGEGGGGRKYVAIGKDREVNLGMGKILRPN